MKTVKMKVKVLSRNPDDYVRETKHDIHKVPRNYNPALHPFEAPREYVRALNATKLERVFAKPFLGALEGHTDSVHTLAKHPLSLSTLLSGSCDGQVKIWNLATRKCTRTVTAHQGFVRGLCTDHRGHNFFSVGDDQTIKQWSMEAPVWGRREEPLNTIIGKTIYIGMDHHWKDPKFATCGQQVDIWEHTRTEPLRSFTWGNDSIQSVKFNHVETHLLASCAADRNIVLYDMRGAAPLRKIILGMKTNTIAWNPMEAFCFTAANEDYNLYTFDLRNLSEAMKVHHDHVSAVLDVDYSPTGKEFVTASYDKTIRIFPVEQGRSREIYYTKRMQHVSSIRWSLDNKYLISGSDEMNLRIWKANASEKLGKLEKREVAAMNYAAKLKEKYQHHPQVKRISKHRQVPRSVYTETRIIREQKQSIKRKEENRIRHSEPGSIERVAEKKKIIVGVKE